MVLPGAFDALRDERVWVAWADESGRKVPKSPHGGNAKSNDPSTWGTYAEAEAVRAKIGYSGVGLMLTDGYIGIDLDGAVEDGEIADWAQEIIGRFDSYTELSPSGTGVHIIGWSNVEQVGPIGRNNRRGVEVYNHGRYFTVTGNAVNDAPIMDVTPDLEEFIYAHFPGESPEQAVRRRIGNLARDQVKRQANRTMAENCAHDGVRYARVPRGSETCGFCIMLASRGFVYTTPEAAQHSHDGCDCKVMPGFDGAEVEGYDPDSMYDLYREARSRAEHKTDAEISREIERVLAEREKSVAEMSVKEMESYLERARDSGDIVYSKPIDSFVGTDDERDLSAHVSLHRAGISFEVRAEDAPKGFKNIDLSIDDQLWEVKSPNADGGSKDPLRFVEKNIRKAKKQFKGSQTPDAPVRVVFNNVYTAAADEDVMRRIRVEVERHGIAEVIFVHKDGSVERI